MMRSMLRHPVRFWRDHRLAVAHASDYIDDDLDPADRERIAAHAEICPPCNRLLASLRRTVTGLRSLGGERDGTPGGVADSVIARLRDLTR